MKIETITGTILYESDKITIKEAVEEAVAKGIYFTEANLEGVDLGGENLML